MYQLRESGASFSGANSRGVHARGVRYPLPTPWSYLCSKVVSMLGLGVKVPLARVARVALK